MWKTKTNAATLWTVLKNSNLSQWNITGLATVSDKELNSTRRCKQEIMNTSNNKKQLLCYAIQPEAQQNHRGTSWYSCVSWNLVNCRTTVWTFTFWKGLRWVDDDNDCQKWRHSIGHTPLSTSVRDGTRSRVSDFGRVGSRVSFVRPRVWPSLEL